MTIESDKKARLIGLAYEQVFKEPADVQVLAEQGMVFTALVNRWAVVKEDSYGQWFLTFKQPPPGYRHYRCLVKLIGHEVPCNSLGDAILALCEMEAHRKAHLGVEHATEVVMPRPLRCAVHLPPRHCEN